MDKLIFWIIAAFIFAFVLYSASVLKTKKRDMFLEQIYLWTVLFSLALFVIALFFVIRDICIRGFNFDAFLTFLFSILLFGGASLFGIEGLKRLKKQKDSGKNSYFDVFLSSRARLWLSIGIFIIFWTMAGQFFLDREDFLKHSFSTTAEVLATRFDYLNGGYRGYKIGDHRIGGYWNYYVKLQFKLTNGSLFTTDYLYADSMTDKFLMKDLARAGDELNISYDLRNPNNIWESAGERIIICMGSIVFLMCNFPLAFWILNYLKQKNPR
jgi:hypothetical protein